jgi:hypothetical protein
MAPLRSTHSILTAVLGTVLFLAASEVVVRQWLLSPTATVLDARYNWVYPPNVRVVQSTEGWCATRTNSMGLMDDELRVPRARVRALLLGDSFSAALQVARRDNFQSVAERSLPGLEVINVSAGGGSPRQYADWLEEFGPRLAPDIVIVQLNDGDLTDLLTTTDRAGRAAAEPSTGVLARLHSVVRGRSALVAAAMNRLQIFAAEWRAHPSRPFRRARPSAAHRDPSADPRLPALMDAFHRRIAAQTPHPIYLYIPSVDYFGPRVDYDEPRVAGFYHAFAARNHVTLVDLFQPLCAEFARTGQPLHGFPNSVMGEGHINAAGHRVAGEQLARAIAEATR